MKPQGHDLTFIWTEDRVMKPIPSQRAVAEKRFKVGESYRFRPDRVRGRGGFFNEVRKLWEQLPEQYEGKWDNPDKLRYAVMIHLGYCNQHDHVFENQTEALKGLAYMRRNDPYGIFKVRENVVMRWEAWSMKPDHMTERQFYEINIPILDYIREMIGLPLLGDSNDRSKDASEARHEED